jgi:hypothetical protein
MLSRLKILTSQPKLALGALVTLLLAAGAVVGSGADFTASSANPSNTFTSGTLSMGNSKANAAILSASNLRPGGAAQIGDVDVENTGSLSGAFTLSLGSVTTTDAQNPLVAVLDLIVVDCGAFAGQTAPTCGDGDDTTKYTGTVANLGTVALSNYTAGAKRRYRLSVALEGTAGDVYQGDSSTVQFDFNAA